MKKEKQKKIYILWIVIIVAVFLLAASFAIFNYSSNTTTKNTIKTGTLILTLEEDNALTLVNQAPITDSDAMTGNAYTFKIKNTGTETAKYQITILQDEAKYQEDNCTNKKLPWNKIRFSIIKNSGVNIIKNLQDQDGILTTTTVEAGKTDTYALRLWIDEQAGNEVANLHLHAKIQVKAILENRNDFETGA